MPMVPDNGLENLEPAVRIEAILDGQNISPATRLEYFLQKAATEVPKPTSADAGKVITVNQDGDGYELAAGGSGGAPLHVVRAIGEPNVEQDGQLTTVTMNSDADEDTIVSWLNSGEPVFCLAPRVLLSVDNTTATYEYVDVSMDFLKTFDAVQMEPNSQADSLTYRPFIGSFEWVFTESN